MAPEEQNPAVAYQEYFGPAIFEPLLAHTVELARPREGEKAIDVACGTGIVTRALAEEVGPDGDVAGVDLNPKMIEVARSLPAAGEVEWRVGDGTALDFPDSTFDLACCQQGLQFFPDPAAGVSELRRILKPGGRAAVAVWRGPDEHPLFSVMADIEEPHLAAFGIEVSRAELLAPFSLGSPDSLRDLFRETSFSEVEVETRYIEARFPDPDNFVQRGEYAYAAVIPQFAENPEAFQRYLDAVADDARELVESHRVGDHVVVPMRANIALAVA
jgi:ubiquinone/menaquinone biosynthesis C-methylase UbiE